MNFTAPARTTWALPVAALLFAVSCRHHPPEHPWLRGDYAQRLDKVAEHLRGNDVLMAEVGYRHRELYAAIGAGNQPYSLYQFEKILLAMKMGVERRPKRKPSFDWFFAEAVPPMKAALESGREPMEAYKIFTTHCITCHAKEELAYIPVAIPWAEPSPPPAGAKE